MKEQGAQRSMSWLGPIIQNDPETLAALPITCLCELILSQSSRYPIPESSYGP